MQLVDAPPREKVPPQNIEAETAVLGSMLIDEEAIPRGIEKLRPESFYHPPHRKIFQTIISLFEDNRAVDLVTLTERLTLDQALETVGGASYLTELTGAMLRQPHPRRRISEEDPVDFSDAGVESRRGRETIRFGNDRGCSRSFGQGKYPRG